MNKLMIPLAAVALVACAVMMQGCVDGAVGTNGYIATVSEYGAVIGHGATMRATPNAPSIQYTRTTNASIFNSLARETQERLMIVLPGTNAIPEGAWGVLDNVVNSTNNLPAVYGGYSPAWSAPAKAATGVTISQVEAELQALKAKAGATNAVTAAACTGTNCTECANGACTPGTATAK